MKGKIGGHEWLNISDGYVLEEDHWRREPLKNCLIYIHGVGHISLWALPFNQKSSKNEVETPYLISTEEQYLKTRSKGAIQA